MPDATSCCANSPELNRNKRAADALDNLTFPVHRVGSYSCHGLVPDTDDENDQDEDTKAKINQDRGCICYPFGQINRGYQQVKARHWHGHRHGHGHGHGHGHRHRGRDGDKERERERDRVRSVVFANVF